MNQTDPYDPIGIYVSTIRSVLFIDDQFPTYGRSTSEAASEADRARALWKACTDKGWLCDIDNSADWTSPERQQRLAACDLLVLDYHLAGGDSVPALAIIRDLAASATPNLVVVYTQEPNLAEVLLKAASWARGIRASELPSEDLEELEDLIEWSFADLVAFLSNKDDWKKSLKNACVRSGRTLPEDSQCIALIERKLQRDYGVEPAEAIRSIERIEYETLRWLQCGNLFLVVVGKSADLEPSAEAAAVFGCLEDAVRQWAPSWLACLVAGSRRHIEAGSFRDDARLLDERLQEGLLGYIGGPGDNPERSRRASEIATHILSLRSNSAAALLGEHLLARATVDVGEPLTEVALLHLNAFLCSELITHHHLRAGSIFACCGMAPQYWICVTPACDMVPREPSKQLNPWASELDPFRPMLALRLNLLNSKSDVTKALKEAERGRHVFFWDRRMNRESPLVASCFQDTSDPNPQLEQMIAASRAQISDGMIELYRCVRKAIESGESRLALERIECVPVAQLRAPYAERVVHVVGGHVSRIGVNFVRFKTTKP